MPISLIRRGQSDVLMALANVPSVLNAASVIKTDCKMEGSMGTTLMLKSLHLAQKENRYIYTKNEGFYRTVIVSLLAPTGNYVQASFLVHQVSQTSTIVACYFMQVSLPIYVLYNNH